MPRSTERRAAPATRPRAAGRGPALGIGALLACLLLPGCAVVSVASAVVSVGAGAVGLVADAAVGTVRLTGKAVGAAADAVIPDGDPPPAP